jgi:hypothetical protein
MTPDLNRPEKSEMEKIFGFPERNGSRVHYEGVNEKCILFRENNQPKPAYCAYQNLCAVWAREYKPHPVESCERIGSAELAGSFPRSLLRG